MVARVLSPVLPNQRRLHIQKNLNGEFIITLGSEGIVLNPRQTYDVAVSLLKNLGIEVNETHKRPDDFGGDVLKANIKLTG